MSNFKATRIIRSDKVRQMCINYNLYTCGNSEQYTHMLNTLCGVYSPLLDDYETIAADILSHSRWEDLAGEYNETYDGLMEIIISKIINECSYMLIEKLPHELANSKFENPMYNKGYDDGFADGANSIESEKEDESGIDINIYNDIEKVLSNMVFGRNYREYSEDTIKILYPYVKQIIDDDIENQRENGKGLGELAIDEDMIITAMMMTVFKRND